MVIFNPKTMMMRRFLLVAVLTCFSFFGFTQSEYAEFSIDGKSYTVDVSTEVIASMDAGQFILLGPNNAKGMGITAMITEREPSTYELTGSSQPPLLSLAVSNDEAYSIEEGVLEITAVTHKFYEGTFKGTAKRVGTDAIVEVSGKFKVELDM